MVSKIQAIKEAANANVGAFLRALYGYDVPKRGNTYLMGNVHGVGGDSLFIYEDSGNWMDAGNSVSSIDRGDLIDLAEAHWGCSKATLYDRLSDMLGVADDFRKPHPIEYTDKFEAADIDAKLSELNAKTSDWANSFSLSEDDKLRKQEAEEVRKKELEEIAARPPTQVYDTAPKKSPNEPPPWKPAPTPDPWTSGAFSTRRAAPKYVWPFRNKDGDIVFYVARFETPMGKTFTPAYWDGTNWIAKKPIMELYPLLGANLLWQMEADDDTVIVLVEGEKSASVGNSLQIDGYWFTTWHGGAKNIKKIDLRALYNKKVILWPDNDVPGTEAMNAILGALKGHALVSTVSTEEGWDIGDDVVDVAQSQGVDHVKEILYKATTLIPEDMGNPMPANCQEPSQLGSVRRFLYKYGKDVKYSQESGVWYLFKDGWWQEDRGMSQVFLMATSIVDTIWTDCTASNPKDIEKYFNAARNTKHIEGILNGVKMDPNVSISEHDFDPDPDIICVANGMLDLRTGVLRKGRRDDMASKQIPFEYDKNAKCPRFMEFMEQIMQGNSAVIQFLQQYFGYSLTGNPPDRIFVIFLGSGRNGKSTLINIIKTIMGAYHVTARTESIMSSDKADRIGEDVIPLRGARLITMQESEVGMRIHQAKIKSLTGQDTIRARYLHSNSWLEWVNTGKFIMATNYKPKVTGNDRGIWDRICMINFGFQVPVRESDPDLHTKILEHEAQGVLTWMVKGAAQYFGQGKKIFKPDVIMETTQEYQEDEDTIGSYVNECLEFGGNLRIGASELYRGYKKWMDDRMDDYTVSTRTFSELVRMRLNEHNVAKVRTSTGIEYRGVGRKATVPAELFEEDDIPY